jgi:Domain of unknown function (DUF4158)
LPAVHETAYPRLKHSISNEELHESYTPSADELALADEASKGTGPKICLLVLLKVFQRLGYFVRLRDVPKPIAEHISLLLTHENDSHNFLHFSNLELIPYIYIPSKTDSV